MHGQRETASKYSAFVRRHIGPDDRQVESMLDRLGVENLDELIDSTIPDDIRYRGPFDLGPGLDEAVALDALRERASRNELFRSFIGMGYYGTITPAVVQRGVLENPAWYTAYTPYQAEISQGRLEALVNFQTLVCDLTGLEVANASLLDEATAAAEAMSVALQTAGRSKDAR
jgi:glycine dehydrogenase